MKEDMSRDVETPKVCKQAMVLTQKVNVGPQINFVAKIPFWPCLSVILI